MLRITYKQYICVHTSVLKDILKNKENFWVKNLKTLTPKAPNGFNQKLN